MGFLSQLFKEEEPPLPRLAAGSFTVDREGRVVSCTLPRTFPTEDLEDIAQEVLSCFRGARESQVPVRELIVHYAALQLTARELRGGAIIFLNPQTLIKN